MTTKDMLPFPYVDMAQLTITQIMFFIFIAAYQFVMAKTGATVFLYSPATENN